MFQPTQGLSKRELIKLQRFIHNEQVQKALTHQKSYRRRSQNAKNCPQPPPRKVIKTQAKSVLSPSEEASSSLQENTKKQESQGEENDINKVQRKKTENPTHINIRFGLEEGQGDLFNYIMAYSYEQKSKYMEEKDGQIEFLNDLKGKSLEKVDCSKENEAYSQTKQKYDKVKTNIEGIYDPNYKNFVADCFKSFLK